VPVAHRGGTEKAMENTVEAFRSAGAAGITRWELDVHFDVHGTPVVLHDDTVDRVSPLSGPVSRLDATDGRIPTDGGGHVPTLREVYAEAVRYHAFVLTEVKVMPTAAEWRRVLADIDRSVGRKSVLLMSFGEDIVLAARKQAPDIGTGLLQKGGDPSAPEIERYGGSLLKSSKAITKKRARGWAEGGLTLYAWTVDSEAEWAHLDSWPVFGVITNRPIAYRAWAAAHCRSTSR
jgi:glycerophosphoryl diester phosphodiesterase